MPSLRADFLEQLREGERMTGRRMEFKTSTAETREAELSWEDIEVEGTMRPCILAFMRDIPRPSVWKRSSSRPRRWRPWGVWPGSRP